MRGKLSKGIQEKSLKNGESIKIRTYNAEEEDILFALQKEKHIKLEESGINFKCVCTREYYDYIQDILADSYVEEWL